MCASLRPFSNADETAMGAPSAGGAPATKRPRRAPEISEADFQTLERILNDGKRERRLRTCICMLVRAYAELSPLVALAPEKEWRRRVHEVRAAALRLTEALAALELFGLFKFKMALRSANPLKRLKLLTEAAALAAQLVVACSEVLKTRPGRRRTSNLYWVTLRQLADLYRAATGRAAKIERPLAGGYSGDWLIVATIVCRAMALAAGEKYPGDVKLGRRLRENSWRFTSPRARAANGAKNYLAAMKS